MLFLSKDDFYEVYLKSIISDFDRDTLSMLYQPIIGGAAVALYLSLQQDHKKIDRQFTHEELINSIGFSIDIIQDARSKLEAIGLLSTYYKTENGQTYYKYVLYAPKTPKDFFDDILFKGLLIEKIGEKKVQSLVRKYKEKKLDLNGFHEISASFKDVFNPQLDNNSFIEGSNITGGYGRNIKDISKGFDASRFLEILESNYHISNKYFYKKDIKKLSEISMLYGIEESVLAEFTAQCYLPDEKEKIDYEALKELCIKDKNYQILRSGNKTGTIAFDTSSKLSRKIELMSTYSALDYLKLKQKNGVPSPSDIKLITDLFEEYGLNSGVINALIDYCLERNNNILSRSYVTKIAASIARENITSTIDTMNYLLKNQNKRKTTSTIQVKENKNEEISDKELDDLLEDL
ncbi:MAG: hypothetical protein E7177_02625 [Erysipelotrichaceae bacterium]|nr:hypothetical protein [Erysipelotrichaceae bacterium]